MVGANTRRELVSQCRSASRRTSRLPWAQASGAVLDQYEDHTRSAFVSADVYCSLTHPNHLPGIELGELVRKVGPEEEVCSRPKVRWSTLAQRLSRDTFT